MASLSVLDVSLVVISLLVVFVVALWGAIRARRSKKDQADEYFLAGRSMPWTIIAASLFASNIGAEHFVGQTGAAAVNGMSIALYDWLASYAILALGWLFAPVFISAKLHTIPEYLERRFNSHCRFAYVVITMLAYVVTKIGATLYAGSILLDVLIGFNIWQSTPLIIIATASYTIVGGLTAVMLTDTIQTLIFLFGGLVGLVYALDLVGGLFPMLDRLSDDSIGLERLTHVIRPLNDRDVPSLGMIAGILIGSIWYWCVDQEMAQRMLSAKSLPNAKMGAAAAALLKSVPAFITVVPGTVARALYEFCKADESGETFPRWCDHNLSQAKHADKAYPLMILHEFPSGIRGIMVASFLAAMMSSLSSVYNSASTIFTYDVYERFFGKGRSSPEKLVNVGRIVTMALTSFTFLWLPVVQHSSRGLYIVGHEAGTHIVPTISAVFIAGLFMPWTNGTAAISGIVSGVMLGLIRAIPFFLYQDYCDDRVDPDTLKQNLTWTNWTVCLNFNYFAIILFVFTLAVISVVSYFTEGPSESEVQGLVSQLVRPMYQNQEAETLQMTNVQYQSVGETGSQELPENENSHEAPVKKGEMDSELENSSFKTDPLAKRIVQFWSIENGYLPHILSLVAVVCITTLIIIFH